MEALNGFTYKVTGVYETLVYQIRTSSIAYGIYRTTEGCSTYDRFQDQCISVSRRTELGRFSAFSWTFSQQK